MAIYGKFGSESIQIVRPVETIDEVKQLTGRKPDKHDRHRLEYGMYAVAQYDDGEERLVDLGTLRADDGISEINKAARAAGCNPK